ncbi:unnamed protein product, partial [Prorocentrum cordatum]
LEPSEAQRPQRTRPPLLTQHAEGLAPHPRRAMCTGACALHAVPCRARREERQSSYEQLDKCLKLTASEDSTNRTKVADLMRYYTSKTSDVTVSLQEHVNCNKDGPNDIYCITGDDKQLKEFDGKRIKATTKTASQDYWQANMERNDSENEERKSTYPTASFDRNITNNRAMMCTVLILRIGNNQGMGDVGYDKIYDIYVPPQHLRLSDGPSLVVDTIIKPNISRETLQQNKILRATKKNIVKKCLEMFVETAEKKDDYKKFHEQFGKCLKLGVHEDSTNRTKVAELMRYHTSKSGDEMISLKEYLVRMKEGQNDIYHITGKSIAAASSSPFLETLRKKGLEVLYMTDSIDEYSVQQLKAFDGKKFNSTTKEGLDLEDEGENEKKKLELKAEFEPLTKLMKEVLGDKAEKVVASSRMADSPCALTTHGLQPKPFVEACYGCWQDGDFIKNDEPLSNVLPDELVLHALLHGVQPAPPLRERGRRQRGVSDGETSTRTEMLSLSFLMHPLSHGHICILFYVK